MTIGLNLGINLGFFDHHGRPRLGHHCHGKWVEIPNLDSPCMQEISRFAVEEYNHRYRKNLTYQFIYAAWYLEVDARSVKYRLHIQVAKEMNMEETRASSKQRSKIDLASDTRHVMDGATRPMSRVI
ncbi:hypothetical protein SDJN03_00884, partial [Cucurbita argyrosperma subsp. sororia]